MSDSSQPARSCGACSLCCTVLRVDELKKLGGVDCQHQRKPGEFDEPKSFGCAIHDRRPQICRSYHCLWIAGGLSAGDRPDKLGAVVDILGSAGIVLDVSHENVIKDNLIGVDMTGTAALGNASNGIRIEAGSTGNIIGPGNVIAANSADGIFLLAASGNQIFDNFVGISSDMTTVLGNAPDGISINNGS